jgi:hypothetical protein
MTDTLTERYLREVVRHVPAHRRDAVSRAVGRTIAELTDARRTSEPEPVERAVLAELGDPARVAVCYGGRHDMLIGPDSYPAYSRLLKGLLTAVVPALAAALMIVDVMDDADVGSVIGTGIGTAVTAAAHIIAWTTVLFAVAERRGEAGPEPPSATSWTPDDLPQPGAHHVGPAWISSAWHAALLGVIVWQRLAMPYRPDGGATRNDGVELLDPALWSGWIWPILGGLTGIVALHLTRAAWGRWSAAMVRWYAVAHAGFALPLAWVLSQQRLFNPEFLVDFNGGWSTPDAFYTATALGVLAASAWDVADRIRETRT